MSNFQNTYTLILEINKLKLVFRKILTQVNAHVLDPEQRSVLETANDIARELKMTMPALLNIN